MMLDVRDIALAGRLNGVSAMLHPGEVTAICGPNGAGKSSLLSCLAGICVPDSGSILLDDVPLGSIAGGDRAKAIGYLPQSPDIAWDVSVEVLVSLGRIPWKGAPAGEEQAAIDSAIAALDLEAFRHRPVSRLSGGERARALMARVLATRPQWLLADEPLANLDLAHAATLVAQIRNQASDGRGVVIVLHDLAMAMNHADRVLVLDEGRLVADDVPAQALNSDVVSQVWQVGVRWHGEKGAMALSIS